MIGNSTIKLIPPLCTLSHLHIFIQHLKRHVTVDLFRPLTGTLYIIQISHQQQDALGGWGGAGAGGGGGGTAEGCAWRATLGTLTPDVLMFGYAQCVESDPHQNVFEYTC